MSQETIDKLSNREMIDGFIAGKGTDMYKEASEGAEEYLRMRLYEDGFFRKILPGKTITFDDLDDQVDTDRPVIICEKEPNAAAAYTVPFGTMPIGNYMRAPKFRVMFDRVMSRRYKIDIDLLGTYRMNLKTVLENILLKKIQEEEDRKFLYLVNYIVTQGKPSLLKDPSALNYNSKNAEIEAYQNITFDGMDRDTLAEMTKGLPSTNRSLNPSLALINNITVRDVVKLARNEVGGDLSQEMFKNGFSEQKIMGIDWVVTIKKNLVPIGTVYQFAEPKFTGKSFFLRDVTLETKAEANWIEFFAWETLGAAIGNAAAVCACHFDGTSTYHWDVRSSDTPST